MIDEYFRMLEDWKRLPAYKLETRIDSLFGFALPKIVENLYGIRTQVLIPELPIRLATVHPQHEGTNFANRSYKVDFYIRSESDENIFLEFKSDSGSRREGQDNYLQLSMKFGMKAILKGILTIYSVTSYRSKYEHLLEKLILAKLLDRNHDILISDEKIRVMYAQPKSQKSDEHLEVLDFQTLAGAILDCFPDSELMTRFASSLTKWADD